MVLFSKLWSFKRDLFFDSIEEETGDLSDKLKTFIKVCELADLEKHMYPYGNQRLGRKKQPRIYFAKAFVAKSIFDMPTTKDLIEYLRNCQPLRSLCGWERTIDVPSEATFSRAFAEFAAHDLGDAIHRNMIQSNYGDKIVGHISRDSTAIKAREKGVVKNKEASPKKARHKRGRPRKNEVREPKEMKRLDVQGTRSLEENLSDLPNVCDYGAKSNSQGKHEIWKGYKLHIDCADGDIPIAALLTSASVHDSQAAIPLAQMSFLRVTNLYDLCDAAYDAKQIHDFSRSLGHVPIIDSNPRGGREKQKMAAAEKRRYAERSSIERVNSMLKDNFGARHVRVRGPLKVKAHLMFGLISICAIQLMRLIP